ncbi:MAG: hypothetical protein EI684_19340 [Candidatus Viridilinea halotolerans]|uniref:Uncharacterized protein n=1 Tax=Candidatus Viridilinea halotolerans TaxID=2491704 RepID=A0A426TSP4_9CHLR|nr:MAG: hypothetical protein EI684_19340 [Candidatus Viridilinea halotolerans]
MTPPRLTLAIDPALAAFRPEITYTWRTLLAGLGYAWQEVAWEGAAPDLAYALDPARAPAARLVLRAHPSQWAQPAAQRLVGVEQHDGWERPRFAVEPSFGPPQSMQAGRCFIERDLIFACFWLLSGQEEQQHPRGKHGYLDLTGTPTLEYGVLRLALVSAMATRLGQTLRALGYPPGLARWPFGAKLAATCGHDVDYPEIIRWIEPLRILSRQGKRGLRPALEVALGQHSHWHFRSWMELEKQYDARSAFFFVARKGSLVEYATGLPDTFYDIHRPKFRALFRELAAEGWEIGLHASYLAYTSADTFAAERAALASASGQPINGNRHHYWHLDPADPAATLLLHEQVGFRYDASLTHNRYLGWRRGANWPFYPWHAGQRRALGTLQLPTAWMDDHLFGQRQDNPGDRMLLLSGLVQRTAAHGGMLLVDVHDYVYDDALFPDWAATYRKLWADLFRRKDVWFATPGAIAEHWRARQALIERVSSGL